MTLFLFSKSFIDMSRSYFLIIFLSLILTACSSDNSSKSEQSKEGQTEQVRNDEVRTEEDSVETSTERPKDITQKSHGITFKRFACPNVHCIPLVVNLTNNKLLLKSGREPETLSKTLYLDESQMQALSQRIKALGLKSMRTVVKPGTKNCATYSTDQPSYHLSLSKGSFKQIFEAYAGCQLEKEQLALIDWFLSFDRSARKTGEF